MTEQMAKECIQGKLDCMNKCDVFNCKDTDECENCNYCYSQGNFGEQKKAFETAIQALTEIQQYRAIGTVKGYERAIETANENYYLYLEYKAKVKAYESIGTVEELQALKEKSVAKEPKGNDGCTCPNCNTFNEVFMKRKNTVGKDIVNCWHCGQAVLLD